MKKEWSYLNKITNNQSITIERVRLDNEDIAIEGKFELPPLAKLSIDDQIFVAAFVKCHGSIKEIEKHFNISYPTVKSRLNLIGKKLNFVQIDKIDLKSSIIDLLEQGEINVDEAIEKLNKGDTNE